MNEKLFRETFSKLRASDQSKEELLNRMENHENKRHGAFRVMRGILVAAAAVCLLTTAAFAGNGLISSWWSRDAQDEYLYRGNFEAARRVEGDVPGTFADGMVQLPYFSVGGKVLVNDEGRVLFYVFAAENDVTHIDEIIDITDLLTASEDGTYRYQKEVQGVTGMIAADLTVSPGWPEYAAAEPVYGSQGYGYVINGWLSIENGLDTGSTRCRVENEWSFSDNSFYSSPGVLDPVIVPATWERNAVTGYADAAQYVDGHTVH